MRWDELFADLEGQLVEAEVAGLAAEVDDRTRREAALVPLADRLRGGRGQRLRLDVWGGGALSGTLTELGPDWLLVDDLAGHEVLVVADAVLAVAGLPRGHAPETSAVRQRLGLASALRGLARDRAAVSLRLRDGSSRAGTVDRVGRDFLELAEHPAGEPRRAAQVSGVRAVPFTALATVTRGG